MGTSNKQSPGEKLAESKLREIKQARESVAPLLRNAEGEENVVSHALVEFDNRLQNLEKLVNAVRDLTDKGLEEWSNQQQRKISIEKHRYELEHRQNGRSLIMLGLAMVMIFVLCIYAFQKEQYSLLQLILSSSFALGAGAGISSLFKNR